MTAKSNEFGIFDEDKDVIVALHRGEIYRLMSAGTLGGVQGDFSPSLRAAQRDDRRVLLQSARITV